MKMYRTLLLSSIVLLILATSCIKKSNPNAGKSGTATLVVYPQHHGISKNIDTCKLYVKYNAQNSPSNNVYDDSTTCTCANGLVTCTFSQLKNGDYYLYGVGYDTSVYKKVGGGLYAQITQQNATTSVDLPVTELP